MNSRQVQVLRFAGWHRLTAVLLCATLLAFVMSAVLIPTPWKVPAAVGFVALHLATGFAAARLCLMLPSERGVAFMLLLLVPFLGWAIAALYCWSARSWLEEELGARVGSFGLPAREVRRWLEGRPCQQCGYNLTGNRSGRCPECGWVIPRGER